MTMPDPYEGRPKSPEFQELEDRGTGSAWPWLAGTAVIVAIVLALTFGTTNKDAANLSPGPATTTSQAPMQRAPAENTGEQPRAAQPANPPASSR